MIIRKLLLTFIISTSLILNFVACSSDNTNPNQTGTTQPSTTPNVDDNTSSVKDDIENTVDDIKDDTKNTIDDIKDNMDDTQNKDDMNK